MTIEQLEAELAALPDDRDVPLSWTRGQLAELQAKRSSLTRMVVFARSARETLAEVGPELAALTTWHDRLVEWRQTLDAELLKLPPRIRNEKELTLYRSLTLSIEMIDRGLAFRDEMLPARMALDDLMEQAGCASPRGTLAMTCGEAWQGSARAVERRLVDLRKRRDEAQAQLDALLGEMVAVTG